MPPVLICCPDHPVHVLQSPTHPPVHVLQSPTLDASCNLLHSRVLNQSCKTNKGTPKQMKPSTPESGCMVARRQQAHALDCMFTILTSCKAQGLEKCGGVLGKPVVQTTQQHLNYPTNLAWKGPDGGDSQFAMHQVPNADAQTEPRNTQRRVSAAKQGTSNAEAKLQKRCELLQKIARRCCYCC